MVHLTSQPTGLHQKFGIRVECLVAKMYADIAVLLARFFRKMYHRQERSGAGRNKFRPSTRAEEDASNFRENRENKEELDQIPYVQGLLIDALPPTMPQWLLSHLC